MRVASPSTSARKPVLERRSTRSRRAAGGRSAGPADVGQLMDQGDPERRRHLGAPDRDAFRRGVVERERAVVLERAHRSDEIDVTGDQPERSHLALDLLQLLATSSSVSSSRSATRSLYCCRQEVDRDRVVEEQAALVLHELRRGRRPGDPSRPVASGASSARTPMPVIAATTSAPPTARCRSTGSGSGDQAGGEDAAGGGGAEEARGGRRGRRGKADGRPP